MNGITCDRCDHSSSIDRYWSWGRNGIVCSGCNMEYAMFREFVVDGLLLLGGHIMIKERRVLV